MKTFIRSLIPPILLQLRRFLFPVSPTPTPAFGSYQEAASSCGQGYDAEKIAQVVVQKTVRLRDCPGVCPATVTDMKSASLALAVVAARRGDHLTCLDFGGAAGAHYLLAKDLFGDRVSFQWNVVETSVLAGLAARRMAGDELRFFSDLGAAAASPPDLLISSGTLQYMPDPIEQLKVLTAVGAGHIFLTRLALADVPLEKRVIVQKTTLSRNGPGKLPPGFVDEPVSYPATFVDRQEFERVLSENYKIELVFLEDRGTFTIGKEPVSMYGYLASRLAL